MLWILGLHFIFGMCIEWHKQKKKNVTTSKSIQLQIASFL